MLCNHNFLSYFGLLQQDTDEWLEIKRLFFHSSGRVQTWSRSGENFLPGLQMITFLLCAHMERKRKIIPLPCFLIKALIPFMRVPLS